MLLGWDGLSASPLGGEQPVTAMFGRNRYPLRGEQVGLSHAAATGSCVARGLDDELGGNRYWLRLGLTF
ncbi:MAG: hypothetical protein K0A95_05360 [Chromatiales bacterium]|nr:hypothetical protein [Gammaproteobacteria bacterium]MBW6476484.1 hypothetical protein [Chromatiales bacterium]